MPEGQTERDEKKVIPIEELQRARDRKDAERDGGVEDRPERPPDDGPEASGTEVRSQITRWLLDELEELPGVRAEKVRLVRDRLRTGYYDRPEVLTEIANRMLGGVSEDDSDPTEPAEE